MIGWRIIFINGMELNTRDDEIDIDKILFDEDRFFEYKGVAYNINHILSVEKKWL